MATIVLIYGQSGTGKSTSLRNFNPDDVAVINVSGKPMPFRTKLQTYNTSDYMKIDAAIHKTERKIIVIDDATYLMTDEFMRTAKNAGYQKYTEMALNFNALLDSARNLPDEKTVYFLGHVDVDQNGNEKFKTIGKMLDNYVTVEGRFTIVLKTVVTDGKYQFATHNSGYDTVKSPLDMWKDDLIDNDLAAVDKTIREYYGI